MIINDLDGYYIVFDTKNWNTELDTLESNTELSTETSLICKNKARFVFLYPSLFLFIS